MKHHRSLVASSHRLSKNCCAIGTPHAHANTPSSSIPAQKASQVSCSKLPQTEQELLRNRYASRACKHPIKQHSGTESITGLSQQAPTDRARIFAQSVRLTRMQTPHQAGFRHRKHCGTEALQHRKHCGTESIAGQKALQHRKHCGTESIAGQKALRHRKHCNTESIAAQKAFQHRKYCGSLAAEAPEPYVQELLHTRAASRACTQAYARRAASRACTQAHARRAASRACTQAHARRAAPRACTQPHACRAAWCACTQAHARRAT